MNGKKAIKKRKALVILEVSSVFLFVFMIKYVTASFSVSNAHFIRFMSVGFFVCLLLAASLFVIYVVKKFKEIDNEEHYEVIKNQKSKTKNGMNECQSCGNRQVADTDEDCRICGITFISSLISHKKNKQDRSEK